MKRRVRCFSGFLLVWTLSILMCPGPMAWAGTKPEPQGAPSGDRVSPGPAGAENDFRYRIIRVAKENTPAVVHIEMTRSEVVSGGELPFESDPALRPFFNLPGGPRKLRRQMTGIGTGMIINDRGYILTNYHVVQDANKLQVMLSDSRQFQARVIGMDAKTDLAVIRIEAQGKLPFVSFGDSDKVEVGEWVVAIGQPRGLAESVSQGIVSATHRQGITDPNTYQDFLQTDAAINPGNSGGPLIDLDGKVIGVTSIIASQSGGFEGIGFAIPSNIAVHVAKELMETGKVVRGWTGMTVRDVPYDRAKALGLSSPKGALVLGVVKGGPAAEAGIKPGDVITSFQGKQVTDSGDLRNLVANAPIGGTASFGILRNGRELAVPVKVRNLEDAAMMMAQVVRERLGADVRPVNRAEQERFGLDEGQGVAVRALEPKGPLAKAGFEVGDLILLMNDQPVAGVDQLASVLDTVKPGQTAEIAVVDHKTGQAGVVKAEVR
jgi:serine protease Do